MEERITELQRAIEQLRQEFLQHRHTGLDSTELDNGIDSQGTITNPDNSAIDDMSRDSIIANIRTRVNQIEQALIGAGILSE